MKEDKISNLMVRITYKQHKTLKFKALEQDTTVSKLIRGLIDGYLDGDKTTPVTTPKQIKTKSDDTTMELPFTVKPKAIDSDNKPEKTGTSNTKKENANQTQEKINDIILNMRELNKIWGEIADELNQQGFKTKKGNSWVANSARMRYNTLINKV